jgi:hypothetical protein
LHAIASRLDAVSPEISALANRGLRPCAPASYRSLQPGDVETRICHLVQRTNHQEKSKAFIARFRFPGLPFRNGLLVDHRGVWQRTSDDGMGPAHSG